MLTLIEALRQEVPLEESSPVLDEGLLEEVVGELARRFISKKAECEEILKTLENGFPGRVALPEELTKWVL